MTAEFSYAKIYLVILMQYYFLYYFAFISIVAVIITVHDKSAAKKQKRRIPEKTLFLVALLGGALAMYITMLSIRHKTLHKRFMIGLPLIIVLQAGILIYYIFYYN